MVDKTRKKLEKKEIKSLKKVNSCKKSKCAKLYKIKQRESKKFEKEQDIKCGKIKSNTKYYDCTSKFYEESSYKNIADEYVECGKIKCKKEKENHKKTLNNVIKYNTKHSLQQ
jgi:hypothetical protein